ncbi:hypothetical protein ES703_84094 [subsurface metagenome]
MENQKAIELLSDYCDRGMLTLGEDFREAVRKGKTALILLEHPTTVCLDKPSRNLLRDAQRSPNEPA